MVMVRMSKCCSLTMRMVCRISLTSIIVSLPSDAVHGVEDVGALDADGLAQLAAHLFHAGGGLAEGRGGVVMSTIMSIVK